jgi:hypothetical protein
MKKVPAMPANYGREWGGAWAILMVQTPSYVSGKCCAKWSHIENFGTADFESDIMEGFDLLRNYW